MQNVWKINKKDDVNAQLVTWVSSENEIFSFRNFSFLFAYYMYVTQYSYLGISGVAVSNKSLIVGRSWIKIFFYFKKLIPIWLQSFFILSNLRFGAVLDRVEGAVSRDFDPCFFHDLIHLGPEVFRFIVSIIFAKRLKVFSAIKKTTILLT